MIFHFKISGDNPELIAVKEEAYTGNVNTYSCLCEFDGAWEGLDKFIVFSDGERSVTDLVGADNTVIIPEEMLNAGKKLLVGFFADSFQEDNFKRISTGFAEIEVRQGAYQEGAASPEIPEPDLWEKLVNRNLPIVGENGNWQVWDIETGEYRDSGAPSNIGMSEARQSFANALTEKMDLNEPSVELTMVSPVEHIILAKVSHKNIVNTKVFANEKYSISEDGSVLNVNTSNGWYSETMHFDEPIIKKGEKVTISVGEYTCSASAYMRVHLQDVENTISTGSVSFKQGTKNGKVTITAGIDVKDIFVSVEKSGVTAKITNLQIERGSEATEYEPYIEDMASVTVTEEFSGREYSSDGNGITKIISVSPTARIATDKGVITHIEYNRDTNSILNAVNSAISANAQKIGTNEGIINTLNSMISQSGYIYHDWYYPNGGGGSYQDTIGKDDYGLFLVMSDGSAVSYTSDRGYGDISLSGQTHILIKAQNSQSNLSTMWHIVISKGTLGMPNITSVQYYPKTDITVVNNDTSSGMNIIRIPMRSPR